MREIEERLRLPLSFATTFRTGAATVGSAGQLVVAGDLQKITGGRCPSVARLSHKDAENKQKT